MSHSQPLRILIADDHEIARFALVKWLEEESQHGMFPVSVVAAVSTGKQVLDSISSPHNRTEVDMVVIDLDMPDMTGLEVVKRLRAAAWMQPILVISGSHLATARDVLAAGANGFVSKQEEQAVFVEGVRFLAQNPGKTWVSPSTHRQLLHTDVLLKKAGLTPAEQSVLRLAKYSNKEIADELGIAESTVKKHFWSIFQKLGIASRYDAIAFAMDAGLIASR